MYYWITSWWERFVPRGSVVLAFTTFGSYAMGLLRDRTLAQQFGASVELDSYNAAFLLPDFLFNLLVASGIAAAAIPLFTELWRRNRQQAYEYMNTVTTGALVTMAVTGVLVFVTAPWLSYLVAPGLLTEAHALLVSLMRIIAFSPILFAVSNALGALLVARKRFFFYGLSPILYNAGIIFGALVLSPVLGVTGVAYGTLVGAGLHMGVRIFDAWRAGWYPQLQWQWRMPEIRRTIRLMLPKMVGHPIELITFWIFTSLSSLLAPGSITVLNFARNFQSVPVSLLGITMATAVFPTLAEVALRSRRALRALVFRTAGVVILASAVAAAVVFTIRRPLVALLLGGGAFDEAAVAQTAITLGVFCLAIPTESLNHLLARAFYASQNTVIPVAWSVAGLVVAGGSAALLLGSWGIIALPMGFFLGSLLKTVGLGLSLVKRTNRR